MKGHQIPQTQNSMFLTQVHDQVGIQTPRLPVLTPQAAGSGSKSLSPKLATSTLVEPFMSPTNPFAKLLVQTDSKLLSWQIDYYDDHVQRAMHTLGFTAEDLTFVPYERFAEQLISEDIQQLKYNYSLYEVYRSNL
jgi:hypothetical protein